MAEFKAFEANIKVNGPTILSLVNGMGKHKEMGVEILEDNGIENIKEDGWYSQQAWLDSFKDIASEIGESTLFNIGKAILESAQFPPEIDAIEKGLSLELIRSCIKYSNDHSDQKTWQRYRSHLGQCIDGQWGEGYSREDAGADDAAREQAFLESRRQMPDSVLKYDAGKGCRASQQVLRERGIK